MKAITGYVESIEGYRRGDVSEKIRVHVSYECADIGSSIAFDVPITEAKDYWIGRELTITIDPKAEK